SLFKASVAASSSVATGTTITALFNFAPFVGGSAIFVSWILTALALRLNGEQLGEVVRRTYRQMWGACLVGVLSLALPMSTTTPAWPARSPLPSRRSASD